MYLYLYFKYIFGWVLVLVLEILFQSILPITADTKSIPNPNSNPNHTTKQHAIVNIQLHVNIVTCPTYPDKFIRDNVVAPSVRLLVVIVTLPIAVQCRKLISARTEKN